MDLSFAALLSPTLWVPVYLCVLVLAGWRWSQRYGWPIGLGATGARFLWTLPFLCMLFPRAESLQGNAQLLRQRLHIFVDDSPSMKRSLAFDREEQQQKILRLAKESCAELGCELSTTLLTEASRESSPLRFSRLKEQLETWFLQTRGDPWLILSDGEDSEGFLGEKGTDDDPAARKSEGENSSGVVMSFAETDPFNIAISKIYLAPLAFENTPLSVRIAFTRTSKELSERSFQLQIYDGGTLIAAENVSFVEGSRKTSLDFPLKALTRGQHPLRFWLTPHPKEKQVWDNERTKTLDVVANTIGVLHILGAPSWDGRLLRRFFKDEPKFDLISFFILRDPWDIQVGNERELSLIPFPTERLFTQELPHFQVVVMQNFSIFQFLSPTHQEALVQYVLGGGALFFIGGSRALTEQDLRDSPLKRIFPFQFDPRKSAGLGNESSFNENRPIAVSLYDRKNLTPSAAQVYDEFSSVLTELPDPWPLQGAYAQGAFKLKTEAVTPLLTTAEGDPFLIASFPGKGRALWLLSDSLWTLAMNGSLPQGRMLYNEILAKSIRWLTQRSWEAPLQVSSAEVYRNEQKNAGIRLELVGPALLDPTPPQFRQLEACGQRILTDQLKVTASSTRILLEGNLSQKFSPQLQCSGTLAYQALAAGSDTLTFFAESPRLISDDDFVDGTAFLRAIATKHSGIFLEVQESTAKAQLEQWLRRVMKQEGPLPSKENQDSIKDRYWIFESPWIFLLILCLPLEAWLRTMRRRIH